jgi:hypothetical protein
MHGFDVPNSCSTVFHYVVVTLGDPHPGPLVPRFVLSTFSLARQVRPILRGQAKATGDWQNVKTVTSPTVGSGIHRCRLDANHKR